MNVAVPSAQQSLRFGQPASSHTVTRPSSRTVFFSEITSGPWTTFGRSHSGLRDRDRQAVGDADLRQAANDGARALHRERMPTDRREGASRQRPDAPSSRRPHTVAACRATTSATSSSDASMPSSSQRRHRLVGDPARHDVLAHVAHVGGDVEREAVHRATMREPHTDRADLARVGSADPDPHAGVVVETADIGDAQLGEAGDDHPLDRAHVIGGADRSSTR